MSLQGTASATRSASCAASNSASCRALGERATEVYREIAQLFKNAGDDQTFKNLVANGILSLKRVEGKISYDDTALIVKKLEKEGVRIDFNITLEAETAGREIAEIEKEIDLADTNIRKIKLVLQDPAYAAERDQWEQKLKEERFLRKTYHSKYVNFTWQKLKELNNKKSDTLRKRCKLCGITGSDSKKENKKIMMCVCRSVRYCSREHQRLDWPEHKLVCKKPAEASGNSSAKVASVAQRAKKEAKEDKQ